MELNAGGLFPATDHQDQHNMFEDESDNIYKYPFL
jgi:hypothetical protein